MSTALLLHGWGGNSKGNWFPWLEKELNSKLLDVYIPNLPNSHNPVRDEQREYINIYSSDFKKGGYIIAHSLGGILTLDFIQENNIKNSLIILVAPSYPGLSLESRDEILGDNYGIIEYYNIEIDFEKINKFNNKFVVFLSDNDPYINMENAQQYYNKLKNIKFKEFKNKGHFNKSSGVLELPEILEYID